MSYFPRIQVTTEPASEPVSTAEAKAHLRIPSSATSEDSYIDALVTAARLYVEEYTERKLITQTVTEYRDALPGDTDKRLPEQGRVSDAKTSGVKFIELRATPVQSVSSVTTYDDADNGTEWASSNYRLSPGGQRWRVAPTGSAAWPTYTRNTDGIVIVYVAGYGDAGSDVPAPIVEAIKMLVAHWYENREAEVIGKVPAELKLGVDALLRPYRVMNL